MNPTVRMAIALALAAGVWSRADAEGGAKSGSVASSKRAAVDYVTAIEAYRVLHATAGRSAIDAVADAKISAATRWFPDPIELEIEHERPTEGGRGNVSVMLNTRVAFGAAGQVEARYRAAAEVESIAAMRSRLDGEREFAFAWLELSALRDRATIANDAAEELAPLVKRASAAARTGAVSAYLATRWALRLDAVRAESEDARHGFAAQVRAINGMTGLAIADDPFQFLPGPIPREALPQVAATPEQWLVSQAAAAKDRELSAETVTAKGRHEIAAGVGTVRDLEDEGRSSIKVSLTLPLGQGAAARSESRALERERDANRAQAVGEAVRGRDRAALLAAAVERHATSVRLAAARVGDLGDFARRAGQAMREGRGDTAELVETLLELYEAKVELVAKHREAAAADVEYRFFVAAGDNAGGKS